MKNSIISGISACAINATLDGRRHENLATKIGDAYSRITDDPRGSIIGRIIDTATPDIEIDLDQWSVRIKRR